MSKLHSKTALGITIQFTKKSKRRNYTHESKVKMVKLFTDNKYTVPQISKAFGIANNVLQRWCSGLHMSSQGETTKGCKRSSRKQYSVEFKIQVVKYYKTHNKTQHDVAKEFNLSHGTMVSSWLRLYNEGKLDVDNAIAISHTPWDVQRSKEGQTRYKGNKQLKKYLKKMTDFLYDNII